jgi:hypothetical protein
MKCVLFIKVSLCSYTWVEWKVLATCIAWKKAWFSLMLVLRAFIVIFCRVMNLVPNLQELTDSIIRLIPLDIYDGPPWCLHNLYQTVKLLASDGPLHLWEQFKVTRTHARSVGRMSQSFPLQQCQKMYRTCHRTACIVMQRKWWNTCDEIQMLSVHCQMQIVVQLLCICSLALWDLTVEVDTAYIISNIQHHFDSTGFVVRFFRCKLGWCHLFAILFLARGPMWAAVWYCWRLRLAVVYLCQFCALVGWCGPNMMEFFTSQLCL